MRLRRHDEARSQNDERLNARQSLRTPDVRHRGASQARARRGGSFLAPSHTGNARYRNSRTDTSPKNPFPFPHRMSP